MQSSAEALIQTITGHSNSTADLLILTQQFIHLVDENLTRHRTSLQTQNNDLQQFKERTRKRLRDQDEIIERAFARIVTLEAKLEQTTKLATHALKKGQAIQLSSTPTHSGSITRTCRIIISSLSFPNPLPRSSQKICRIGLPYCRRGRGKEHSHHHRMNK